MYKICFFVKMCGQVIFKPTFSTDSTTNYVFARICLDFMAASVKHHITEGIEAKMTSLQVECILKNEACDLEFDAEHIQTGTAEKKINKTRRCTEYNCLRKGEECVIFYN